MNELDDKVEELEEELHVFREDILACLSIIKELEKRIDKIERRLGWKQ